MRPAAAIAMIAVLGVAGGAACGNRQRENREPPRDARRAPRVIEPSTDRVGPLPPYAIRAEGVGPYKLGEKLSVLLEQLPSGPQIALFEIPGVVHRSVIRAEDDTILVGGEQASTASFIAIVGPDVARAEGKIHVGSTRDELVAALGPPVEDPERAHDPRLLTPSALPNLRVVLGGDRVTAIVVTGVSAASRQVYDCPRPATTERGVGSCLTGAGELIETSGDEVMIRAADGERTLATSPKFPGLVFAAPLRNAAEGRDELVVVTRVDEAAARSWWVAAYRLEGTRLLRTVDPAQVYQLSNANARWIGSDLHDVELYLELFSRAEGIEVGGLLATHSASRGKQIADVVVISPAQVARHRGKTAAAEASDAGAPGASPAGRVTQGAAVRTAEPAAADSESSRR
ncbi:MAG TPA: hypothetical protein VF516_07295 [Kofleriaceae bacterium]